MIKNKHKNVQSNWWKPTNLLKTQESFLANNDLDKIDVGNDFGSYKIMRKTGDFKKSKIASHNNINPDCRVKFVKVILGTKSISSILDIGCGLGYTTDKLRIIFKNARVSGVDISEDAVEFAKEKFKKCQFSVKAINPNDNTQFFKYDLITAFEFYPFTRTNCFEDHVSYINHLTKGLNSNGSLIISQYWKNPLSLSVNYDEIKSHFKCLTFKEYDLPSSKIFFFFKSIKLSLILTKYLYIIYFFIFRKKVGKSKVIVIKKNN